MRYLLDTNVISASRGEPQGGFARLDVENWIGE